jgi:polyhydroxybutyrate depolymerase
VWVTLRRWLLVAVLVSSVTACGSTADDEPAAGRAGTRTIKLDDRPFRLHVPRTYDPARKAPLVVLLHGYTSNAADQESYFKLTAESDRRGFLYAMPDGTKDREDKRFWNATAACCDFYRSGVDDSGYLSRLIDAVGASYSVDAARVYLVGHSNGGFMAYRMACEHSTQVSAIVSLAGAMNYDTASCTPERPVRVLQIHGTADDTIEFEGGANGSNPFPSAAVTVDTWRRLNGCGARADTSAAPLDLDTTLSGAETTVTRYTAGCRDGREVELWTIKDGGHVPQLSEDFAPAVIDFLSTAGKAR